MQCIVVLFIVLCTEAAAFGKDTPWDKAPAVEGVSVPLGGVSFLQGEGYNLSSYREEALVDVYEDWLKAVLEAMHGPDWQEAFAPYGIIGNCADNYHFVNQGCQMLFYTCSQTPDEQYWMCRSSFLRSCSCSSGAPTTFGWMVPSVRKCHGNLITDAELLSRMRRNINDNEIEEVFFSFGECRISIMFLTWLLIPVSIFGYAGYKIWEFVRLTKVRQDFSASTTPQDVTRRMTTTFASMDQIAPRSMPTVSSFPVIVDGPKEL